MALHTFDAAAFRAQFPQFADAAKYPDDSLSGYFAMATSYVNANDGYSLNGDRLQLALYLMTAHLLVTFGLAAATGGTNVGVITASTIDGVSITRQVPQTQSAWAAFLSPTTYGAQLLALLRIAGVGGLLVGGSCERSAFRGAGGRF
jgi:hypothetical protein